MQETFIKIDSLQRLEYTAFYIMFLKIVINK